MTIFAVPPTGSAQWREVYPVPPQLRLATDGSLCPMDDTCLRPRMNGVVLQGWDCPVCRAVWNRDGTQGSWTPRRWLSPLRVLGVVAGCFAAAIGIAVPLAALDERLVLAAAATTVVVTAGIVLYAIAGWLADRRQYQHNTVRPLAGQAVAPAAVVGQRAMAAELASPAGPSDDQLLFQLAAVLRSTSGPVLERRLSRLVEYVCRAHCPAEAVAVRAEHLETALAAYLHQRHVLRFRQVTPAELDKWASTAPLVVLHAAVSACARRQHSGAEVPNGD